MNRAKRRAVLIASAIVTGVVQALLPHVPGQLALSCVVLVPFLVALDGASAGESFLAAVVYTLALAATSFLPWLGPALRPYFNLTPARAQLVAAAIVAILAAAHGAMLGVALAMRPRRAGPFLVLWYGALWASWEALRTFVPPQFPGAVLGASLEHSPALLQIASLTGVAGVTAVVVAANAGIAALFARGAPPGARVAACATGLGLAVVATAWGAMRLTTPVVVAPDAPAVLAVDLVAADASESTLDAFIAATPTDRGARNGLVLWPESAISTDLARDRAAWQRISQFVERSGATLVTGGLTFGIGPDGRSERFNSLHVIRPRYAMQSYHKRLLVPFAEFWPAAFGEPPTSLEPVSAGSLLPVFDVGSTTFGPVLCFEIADAASARSLARSGARFLVNLTNDAWFRGTEAPHLPWAQIRAIESGLPVVRVANAGTSVILDPFGRVVAQSEPTAPVGVLEGAVPPAIATVYVATGEVFLPACAVVVALGVVASMVGAARRGALVSERVVRHGL